MPEPRSATAKPSTLPLGQVPHEELRLALVLNGGVSLAVWMGGVAREIDALVRARDGASEQFRAYRPILGATRSHALVDVIAGTSAGGINGACLALSLANKFGKLDMLRDLWAEQGRMDNLLRPPFRGQPSSLLRGDEYFLPELTRAMRGLAADFSAVEGYSVDLTITTTLLSGATTVTTDGLGQLLPQRRHGASFQFSTKHRLDDFNDFDKDNIAHTCARLGLASRCTAGFPFAFEPTFVPVEMPTRGRTAPANDEIGGRPNMWRWASWAERSRMAAEYRPQAEDLSRYAVDGGLLANTPTRQALDAIDRRPAGKPLRRAMLLVFPHAPRYDPAADPADRSAEPPSVAGAASGLLGSLTSQGSLTFVEEIDSHNRRALGWRGGRERLLDNFTLDAIYRLVATGWEFYAATRIQAAALNLSGRVPRPDGWDFARLAATCRAGQTTWRGNHEHSLPYVPQQPPVHLVAGSTASEKEGLATTPSPSSGWGWGTTVALGIADSAAEMLFAAQAQVRVPKDATALADALRIVSDARDAMLQARDEFDDWWWHQPALSPVLPNAAYWTLRLACYDHAMREEPTTAPDGAAQVPAWVDGAVAALRADREGRDRELTPVEQEAIVEALVHTRPNPIFVPEHGTIGARTRGAVDTVVRVLTEQAPLVRALAPGRNEHGGLDLWTKVLDPQRVDGEPRSIKDRLRTRLLTLDAATWMLADAESPGTSQAVSLAQLSLVIDHWWAVKSKTPDDKVAGSELNRFGGFLKQSWRINDWIWGRLDAAQMMCRLVLEPHRLLRVHELTGVSAQEFVDGIMTESYLGGPVPEELDERRDEAVKEVNRVFNGGADDRGYLPVLAGLAAYPIQQQIIVAELPALARAITEDLVTGGNQRSRGAVFLRVESELLTALGAGGEVWRTHGPRALEAFDRAGIGREPLDEESRSDAMIKTAVTAAATMVTLADSDRFGPKVLKPLTKAVRGAALVPYWLVTGLLSGSGVARALGLLGFAVGGLALLLGLFGVLGSFSAAGTTVGAGVVVGALAFAALRSGTLLHGAVLLGAAVPLVALAAPVMKAVNDQGTSAKGSVVSLGAAAAVVVGLWLLAALPNPIRTPDAVWVDAKKAVRHRTRGWTTGRATGAVLGVLAAMAALAGLGCLLWRWVDDHRAQTWFEPMALVVVGAASALVVVVGGAISRRQARGMRRWTQGVDGGWTREPRVTASAGVSAGWAALYGLLFLALAWVAVGVLAWGDEELSDASTFQVVVVAWWALLGAVLSLVAPTWITARAHRTIGQTVLREWQARQRASWNGPLRPVLESRGLLYDYMTIGGKPPVLTTRTSYLRYPPTT